MSLFRPEAVEHQRAKLWGDVIIVQPTSYYFLVALFLLVFVISAIFLASQSYARKETVAGYLSPQGGLSQIYASRGGVITEVLVAAGQTVEEGQALVRLRTEQSLPNGQASLADARASLERELTDVRAQEKQAQRQFEADYAATEKRLHNQAIELEALTIEQQLIEARIALAQRQYDAATDLADKGYAATRLVEEREAGLLGLKQSAAALRRQKAALQSTITDSNTYLKHTLQDKLANDLASIRQRRESLLRQRNELDFSGGYTITAPKAGVVADILKQPGATASPSVPLVTLRAEGSSLIAKLMVPSRAIGLLSAGQSAKIQYDAFPYQRFGVFSGEVIKISAGVMMPGEVTTPIPMQEAFYLVDIKLNQQEILVGGKPISLKPGMALKADITLERRSLVEWIFDPILSLKGKL